LGELTVRWTGADEGEIDVGDEFDEELTGVDSDTADPAEKDDADE